MRVRFRAKLLLLAVAPLALAQLVTLFAVMHTVEEDVGERARESLRVGAGVVGEYLAARSEQLETSVEVLAADFGLKEAFATGDSDTIRSVLGNHSRRVGADLALALDLDGDIIAVTRSGDPGDTSTMSGNIPSEQFLAREFTTTVGDAAYHMFTVALKAPTPIGLVAVGFRLDGSLVERVRNLTGLDAALVAGAERAAFREGPPDLGDLGYREFRPPQWDSGEPEVYVIEGSRASYLATSTGFVESGSNHAHAAVVLLLSTTEAMAPYVEARRGLVAFSIVLSIVVALVGAWLAGSVARPLNRLHDAVRHVITGNYGVPVQESSRDEIGELAASFNSMRAAISERERRISHQAMHDPLTDLPNHANIVGRLARAIESARADASRVYVLSIRLGRMDSISSTLGHNASDELITLAARHLRINLDPGDELGHVGTHEFVVLHRDSDLDAAIDTANRLRDMLAVGVTLGRVNISLQSEIGIAGFPEHGGTAADLLRNASIARSETDTRGQPVAVFVRGREDFHVRQLRIVNDLRGAIHRGEIEAWYQPKILLPAGRPCGAEALVRWRHAEYGWLAPDEFVPAAEEAGAIMHLTRYMLGKAIADCRQWRDAGHDLRVSVNVSARDLCDDYLPYYVLELLKEKGIEPGRLTLEVTESSVMQQLRRSVSVLECLRDIGVRISMDDFGSGHSSLAQLRNIPLHELKVDKSFVMTLPGSAHDAAIVKATVELARSLDLDVVAEGVENESALRLLNSIGCGQAQGYFIAKPLPPADFVTWLGNFSPIACEERRGDGRPFRRHG